MKKRLFTIGLPVLLSTLTAVYFMIGIPPRLSAVRLLFSGAIFAAAAFFLAAYLNLCRLRRFPLRLGVCGLLALGLALLSGIYFDQPAIDRAAAYLRQARPLLYFCGFHLLLITILLTLSKKADFSAEKDFAAGCVLFIACMLLMAAFCPIRSNYYPSHDYAIFSYIGQQILKGQIPYTELWDHKPPVIFYLNALGLKLAGGSLLGIWILEMLCLFAGAWLFYRLLQREFRRWSALSITALGVLHFVRVFDFGNYTEEFSLFFGICGLSLAFSGKRSRMTALLNGILCGLAFTCKQNTIGVWCGIILLEALRLFRTEDRCAAWNAVFPRLLCFAAGFLLVNGAWAAYFAAKGALSAYWDVAFRFNLLYSESSADNRLACAWTTLTFLPSVSPFLLAAFLCWPLLLCLKGKRESLTNWALLTLPIELVFAGLSGMNYQHYFILCIPPACVLLCAAVSRLDRFRLWIVPVLLLCSVPLIPFYRENYVPRSPSAYTKARDYLLENTSPEDPVLVWGSRGAIYVMSERSAPTAYFNERPLYLFSDQIRADQWDELLSDLEKAPPKAVIYTHDTALPFVSWERGVCSAPNQADYAQETYRFFCEHYKYETTINKDGQDAWEVFLRK